MIIFIVFVVFLALALLGLSVLLSPHAPYSQKNSAFECGFSSFLGQNRTEFHISFFLFGILFLIFDLEILLIFPYAVSSYNNSYYGLTLVIIFLLILTAGFVYEFGTGALKINSKQTGYLYQSSISPKKEVKGRKNSFNLYTNQHRSYTTVTPRGPSPSIANVSRVYKNAGTDKAKILTENKNKAGIYRWTNLKNGKSYIGSALDLRHRFIQYYSINHLIDNSCMLICRALIKYGHSNFRLDILEYCDKKFRIVR
jgi:NADH-ubiquinone oxidoreductase chain 3